MRCGCPECDAYMVHADDSQLGCICPFCAHRCTACLGTDSVLSREDLARLRSDPSLLSRLYDDLHFPAPEQEDEDAPY